MDSPPKFTLEQYFAYDGIFEFHLEYHAGRILPVEIPENLHELILMNVTREIRWRIEDEFTTLLVDQRLRPVPEHYVDRPPKDQSAYFHTACVVGPSGWSGRRESGNPKNPSSGLS